MVKELKEDLDTGKMIYEQGININKEIENIKSNPQAKNYNN